MFVHGAYVYVMLTCNSGFCITSLVPVCLLQYVHVCVCVGVCTFGCDDLDQHHSEAVRASVTSRQQAEQQQTGAAAQEPLLLLGAPQAGVEQERPGRVLQSGDEGAGICTDLLVVH